MALTPEQAREARGMDRLTRYIGSRAATTGDMGDLRELRTVVDRLAAYEDTGLTPEECTEFVHKGLPAALDDLDAKDVEIDRLQARCEALEAELSELRTESQHWESDCNTCPLSNFELCHELCHTKERLLSFAANAAIIYDRWKTRCEAMESAIREAGEINGFLELAPCFMCAYRSTKHDDQPCTDCLEAKRFPSWQFNETRFGKGGGSDDLMHQPGDIVRK